MKRDIGGLDFECLGALRLKKDSAGSVVEYTYQLPSAVRTNRYAVGPFCTFDLPAASDMSGVYAIVVGNELKYIGEAKDLARRFGPSGYGHISSRNLHSDGQSTNCRINSLVLRVCKADQSVSIWFAPAGPERRSIESRLVAELAPPWNGSQRPRAGNSQLSSAGRPGAKPATDHSRFASAIGAALADAVRSGDTVLRVRSGDLHRVVGGYPGPSHQMPQCCRAMKAAMGPGDRIIESPPKGAGANLVIEYRLPRVAV